MKFKMSKRFIKICRSLSIVLLIIFAVIQIQYLQASSSKVSGRYASNQIQLQIKSTNDVVRDYGTKAKTQITTKLDELKESLEQYTTSSLIAKLYSAMRSRYSSLIKQSESGMKALGKKIAESEKMANLLRKDIKSAINKLKKQSAPIKDWKDALKIANKKAQEQLKGIIEKAKNKIKASRAAGEGVMKKTLGDISDKAKSLAGKNTGESKSDKQKKDLEDAKDALQKAEQIAKDTYKGAMEALSKELKDKINQKNEAMSKEIAGLDEKNQEGLSDAISTAEKNEETDLNALNKKYDDLFKGKDKEKQDLKNKYDSDRLSAKTEYTTSKTNINNDYIEKKNKIGKDLSDIQQDINNRYAANEEELKNQNELQNNEVDKKLENGQTEAKEKYNGIINNLETQKFKEISDVEKDYADQVEKQKAKEALYKDKIKKSKEMTPEQQQIADEYNNAVDRAKEAYEKKLNELKQGRRYDIELNEDYNNTNKEIADLLDEMKDRKLKLKQQASDTTLSLKRERSKEARKLKDTYNDNTRETKIEMDKIKNDISKKYEDDINNKKDETNEQVKQIQQNEKDNLKEKLNNLKSEMVVAKTELESAVDRQIDVIQNEKGGLVSYEKELNKALSVVPLSQREEIRKSIGTLKEKESELDDTLMKYKKIRSGSVGFEKIAGMIDNNITQLDKTQVSGYNPYYAPANTNQTPQTVTSQIDNLKSAIRYEQNPDVRASAENKISQLEAELEQYRAQLKPTVLASQALPEEEIVNKEKATGAEIDKINESMRDKIADIRENLASALLEQKQRINSIQAAENDKVKDLKKTYEMERKKETEDYNNNVRELKNKYSDENQALKDATRVKIDEIKEAYSNTEENLKKTQSTALENSNSYFSTQKGQVMDDAENRVNNIEKMLSGRFVEIEMAKVVADKNAKYEYENNVKNARGKKNERDLITEAKHHYEDLLQKNKDIAGKYKEKDKEYADVIIGLITKQRDNDLKSLYDKKKERDDLIRGTIEKKIKNERALRDSKEDALNNEYKTKVEDNNNELSLLISNLRIDKTKKLLDLRRKYEKLIDDVKYGTSRELNIEADKTRLMKEAQKKETDDVEREGKKEASKLNTDLKLFIANAKSSAAQQVASLKLENSKTAQKIKEINKMISSLAKSLKIPYNKTSLKSVPVGNTFSQGANSPNNGTSVGSGNTTSQGTNNLNNGTLQDDNEVTGAGTSDIKGLSDKLKELQDAYEKEASAPPNKDAENQIKDLIEKFRKYETDKQIEMEKELLNNSELKKLAKVMEDAREKYEKDGYALDDDYTNNTRDIENKLNDDMNNLSREYEPQIKKLESARKDIILKNKQSLKEAEDSVKAGLNDEIASVKEDYKDKLKKYGLDKNIKPPKELNDDRKEAEAKIKDDIGKQEAEAKSEYSANLLKLKQDSTDKKLKLKQDYGEKVREMEQSRTDELATAAEQKAPEVEELQKTYGNQIEDLQTKYEEKLKNIKQEYDNNILSLAGGTKTEKEKYKQELSKIRQKYKQKKNALKSKYQTGTKSSAQDIKNQYKKQISDLQDAYKAKSKKTKEDYDAAVANAKSEYKKKEDKVKKELKKIKEEQKKGATDNNKILNQAKDMLVAMLKASDDNAKDKLENMIKKNKEYLENWQKDLKQSSTYSQLLDNTENWLLSLVDVKANHMRSFLNKVYNNEYAGVLQTYAGFIMSKIGEAEVLMAEAKGLKTGIAIKKEELLKSVTSEVAAFVNDMQIYRSESYDDKYSEDARRARAGLETDEEKEKAVAGVIKGWQLGINNQGVSNFNSSTKPAIDNRLQETEDIIQKKLSYVKKINDKAKTLKTLYEKLKKKIKEQIPSKPDVNIKDEYNHLENVIWNKIAELQQPDKSADEIADDMLESLNYPEKEITVGGMNPSDIQSVYNSAVAQLK